MSTVYNILSGTSVNYNSIWADSNANINTGKVYVATTGPGAAFSAVDLQRNVVVDTHTIDIKGAAGEFLDSEDIVDINVNIMGI